MSDIQKRKLLLLIVQKRKYHTHRFGIKKYFCGNDVQCWELKLTKY